MDHDTFWNKTNLNILSKYYKAFYKRKEYDESYVKVICESIRQHAFFTILPHIKAGVIKQPTDLYDLPWDNIKEQKLIKPKVTQEDFEKAVKKLDAVKEKKNE